MWTAFSLGRKDPHYDACRPLFDDLHDGKRTVDVSDFVISEVIQVTRRETARDLARVCGSNAPDLQAAWAVAEKAVALFLRRLSLLSDMGKVRIRNPSNNAGQYATLALRMLIRHGGRFEPHGKMGIIYRSLGILDMMHALAARDYRVKNFCTRDRQFSALASDPDFASLNFVIL